jgi:hypothetical protein
MSRLKVEFEFRIWVHPVDGDPPDIEVWYSGLESTKSGSVLVSDWVMESLRNEDFHSLFDLDEDKHWQVFGKGTLQGSYDYFGEYDEEFDVVSFTKEEVPE